MKIQYRIPEKSELEAVCSINDYLFKLSRQDFDPTLSQSWRDSDHYAKFFSSYFKEGNFIYCAYEGEEMIGYISGKIEKMTEESYRGMQKIAMLENLMVLPKHQKQGIGKKLSQRFRDWATENQCSRIQVSVYSKNTQALDFYRQLGYHDYDINLELPLD